MEEVVDPLPVLCALLGALIACLIGLRALAARGLGRARFAWPTGPGRGATALAALAALGASAPLVAGIRALLGDEATLSGDASAHALVAQTIARHWLPHGWIDGQNGGWLFGPQYQPLPVLFLAALVKLGASARAATQATGLAAVLILPPLFVAAARRAAAPPLAALLGALLLAWAMPFQTYVGGPGVYLSAGLLSQALAAPVLLYTAARVVRGPRRPGRVGVEPLLGATCIAAHAQISLAALLLAVPPLLAARIPGARRRYAFVAAGALAMGAALYGPGAHLVAVPVSWAKVLEINIIGYRPARLPSWLLDGKLLDAGRAPVLTTALLIATLILVLAVATDRGPARAALALVVAALGLSVSGHALASMGPLGAKAVEIFSPVRMLCLVPLAAAVAASVALAEVMARVERVRGPGASRGLGLAVLAVVAGTAGASSLRWMADRVAVERTVAERECAAAPGYRTRDAAAWIAGLSRGRLVVDLDAFGGPCPLVRGLELGSPVPTGGSIGGPGSQIGVHQLAFDELHASRPGGAARAEALGVRYVLHTEARPPAPRERFRVLAARGGVALSERLGGADRVGAGCVVARLRGADRALRDALFEDLPGPRPVIADPAALTLLEGGSGPAVREPLDPGGCDPRGARVTERPREPGAFEATISATTEIVAVVRATWTPTWSVRVDGVEVEPLRVAPGFLAARVPAGEHHLEAVVSPPRGYLAGIALAAALVALLCRMARG